MNEICEVAEKRMNSAPHVNGAIYASIFWLTDDELNEFMRIRNLLPSFGQEAADARRRIEQKIRSQNSA